MIAFGVAGTSEKFPETSSLDDHAGSAFRAFLISGLLGCGFYAAALRTNERLGVLAFGVTAAGKELAVPAPLNDHWFPAFFAIDVRGRQLGLEVLHLGLGFFEAFTEGLVKISDRIHPGHLTFFDLVELSLHFGRE